jgi:hypothetical protein
MIFLDNEGSEVLFLLNFQVETVLRGFIRHFRRRGQSFFSFP